MRNQARFGEALQYALELHGAQEMKGKGTPYMAHLLGVTSITLYYGGDEDMAIGALLHDALEDADNPRETRKAIRVRFAETVLAIVEGCTDTTQHPKPAWRPRKEAHVRRMEEVSDATRLVYAADKLQNIRAILQDLRTDGEEVWRRFNGGKAGTFWYYRAMIDVFRKTGTNRQLVDEIVRVVNETDFSPGSVTQSTPGSDSQMAISTRTAAGLKRSHSSCTSWSGSAVCAW